LVAGEILGRLADNLLNPAVCFSAQVFDLQDGSCIVQYLGISKILCVGGEIEVKMGRVPGNFRDGAAEEADCR
jgi:hypothetical protein